MGYSDIKEALVDAKNIATGANDLHLKEILLNLQDMIYELQDENRKLREENHKLKNIDILESELTTAGAFWKKPSSDHLYCPTCWGKDRKLIVCFIVSKDDQLARCPVCSFFASYRNK